MPTTTRASQRCPAPSDQRRSRSALDQFRPQRRKEHTWAAGHATGRRSPNRLSCSSIGLTALQKAAPVASGAQRARTPSRHRGLHAMSHGETARKQVVGRSPVSSIRSWPVSSEKNDTTLRQNLDVLLLCWWGVVGAGFAGDVEAEVAPRLPPSVVLFAQYGADEADQGVAGLRRSRRRRCAGGSPC